jgi:hypothetical protein
MLRHKNIINLLFTAFELKTTKLPVSLAESQSFKPKELKVLFTTI